MKRLQNLNKFSECNLLFCILEADNEFFLFRKLLYQTNLKGYVVIDFRNDIYWQLIGNCCISAYLQNRILDRLQLNHYLKNRDLKTFFLISYPVGHLINMPPCILLHCNE